MDIPQAMELGRNAFWMALSTSAPILLIGLGVGLMISLFQAGYPAPGADAYLRSQDRGHGGGCLYLHSLDR
jgi:hypothetical protein